MQSYDMFEVSHTYLLGVSRYVPAGGRDLRSYEESARKYWTVGISVFCLVVFVRMDEICFLNRYVFLCTILFNFWRSVRYSDSYALRQHLTSVPLGFGYSYVRIDPNDWPVVKVG